MRKVVLASSVVILIFFITLGFLNFYETSITFLGVIRELLTLPLIVISLFLLIFCAIRWIKEKFKMGTSYFFSFLINVLTVLLLVYYSFS